MEEVLHINNVPISYKRGNPVTKDVIDKMFGTHSTQTQNKLFASIGCYDVIDDLESFIKTAAKIVRIAPKELWKMTSYKPRGDIPTGKRMLISDESVIRKSARKQKEKEEEEEDDFYMSSSSNEEKEEEDDPPLVHILEPPVVPPPEKEEEAPVGGGGGSPPPDLFSRYATILTCINNSMSLVDKIADAQYFRTLLSLQLKYVKLLDELTPPTGPLYSVSQRARFLGISPGDFDKNLVGKRARELYLERFGGKEPSQRMIDVGTKHVPANVYTDQEAKVTLDVALLENQTPPAFENQRRFQK